MNMLWNNDIKDVCVVFESWHISGPFSMAVSWSAFLSHLRQELIISLVIIAISIIYAYILSSLKRLDMSIAHSFLTTSTPATGRRESIYPSGDSRRTSSLIPPIPNSYGVVESQGGKLGV
jgi:copper transporter 1